MAANSLGLESKLCVSWAPLEGGSGGCWGCCTMQKWSRTKAGAACALQAPRGRTLSRDLYNSQTKAALAAAQPTPLGIGGPQPTNGRSGGSFATGKTRPSGSHPREQRERTERPRAGATTRAACGKTRRARRAAQDKRAAAWKAACKPGFSPRRKRCRLCRE